MKKIIKKLFFSLVIMLILSVLCQINFQSDSNIGNGEILKNSIVYAEDSESESENTDNSDNTGNTDNNSESETDTQPAYTPPAYTPPADSDSENSGEETEE